MQEESYAFNRTPEVFYYEFYSEGPNGKIRKVIQYQRASEQDEIYNLGFGDINNESGDVDDLSVTNNQDTIKVLATVAKTVLEFMEHHPQAIVMARGSTASRTRLYQMGIAKFWDEINAQFEVKGFLDMDWQPFEKGKNYEAFFIIKK